MKLEEINIEGKKIGTHEVSDKVFSFGKLLESKITFKNNEANVEIINGETGISPGQACVFYSKDDFGDKLLGGGWISKTENKNLST